MTRLRKNPAKKLSVKKTGVKSVSKSPVKISSKKPVRKKAAKSLKTAKIGKGKNAVRQRFTLYGHMLSIPTYMVALMLSLSKHPFSYIHVDLRGGTQKQPDYLVKNRYGQVPALRDGQSYLVQSSAILAYLADALNKFNGKTPLDRQRIREWQFWQWDNLNAPVARLRARVKGLRQIADETKLMYENEAKTAFTILDRELAKSDWLCGVKPTIADIGIYGFLRFSGDAGLDLAPYHHILKWKKRLESLPGFALPEQLLSMENRLL